MAKNIKHPNKLRDPNPNRDFFRQMEATHISPFFNHITDQNEQNTIQSLQDESIVLAGYMVYYVFRTETNLDEVLFEIDNSRFSEAFQIAATYPEHIIDWNNNDALMNKFGINIAPQGEFIFSQRAWDVIMAERKANGLFTWSRPREGDLIIIDQNQRWNIEKMTREEIDDFTQRYVFQVTYVDKGKNNWQLGKDYVWRISASGYKHETTEKIDALGDDDKPLLDEVQDFFRTTQHEGLKQAEKKVRKEEHNIFKTW